jgi:hypothetical protein
VNHQVRVSRWLADLFNAFDHLSKNPLQGISKAEFSEMCPKTNPAVVDTIFDLFDIDHDGEEKK